jgi:putative nucleotidyltransferase with HDIG domain
MAKTTRGFAASARLPWFLLTYTGVVGFGAIFLLLGAATGTLPIFWQVWGALLIVAPIWLARYTFQLSRSARRDLIEFAGALAGIIDEFDPTTRRHSERVSRYAAQLAKELGLSKREIERAQTCGLLHDIGKIAVSQRDIVQKPGPLTEDERAQVALHADIGADILGGVQAFRDLAPIVRLHHERMDGRGYHRLTPDEVPLLARIVTVADAFDAMTSDRVYRPALSLKEAVAELDRHSGRQFDPEIVQALNRLIERGELLPVAEPIAAPAPSRAAPEYA